MIEAKLFFPSLLISLITVKAGAEVPVNLNVYLLKMGDIDIPIITTALAIIGILLARPLTPRRDPPLGLFKNILVTIILALLAVAAVIEYKPGILFTLIVALGLGYSGFSIIELMGDQIKSVVTGFFTSLKSTFNKISNKE